MNKTIHMPYRNLLCCRRENKAPKQDWLVYKKTWQNSTDKSYEPGESTAISLRQVVLCSFEPFISM